MHMHKNIQDSSNNKVVLPMHMSEGGHLIFMLCIMMGYLASKFILKTWHKICQ